MTRQNLLLLSGVVLLAVIPLLMHRPGADEELFGGADGQAEELITQIRPDYEPWFSSFWEPPSGEIESMLFSLQAAIGAGLVCYCIGYYRGRHVRRMGSPGDASG